MIHDDGVGLQQPIMQKDNLCIFDAGDTYEVKKKFHGVIKVIDKKTVTNKFWEDLKKDGWEDVKY